MSGYLTPTGPINLPLWRAARLLVACPMWRTIAGAATAAAAMARVHFRQASDLPDPDHATRLADPRPRAIIDEGRFLRSEISATKSIRRRGELLLSLELPLFTEWNQWPVDFWPVDLWPADFWYSADMTVQDRLMGFGNKIGTLIEQLEARSGGQPGVGDLTDPEGATFLNVEVISQTLPCVEADCNKENGHYFAAAQLALEWR